MIGLELVLYVAAVNLLAFGLFGLDKHLATTGAWRISERTLLVLAAAGGVGGAIAGQQCFRHKTRKEPFRTLLWITPIGQAVALAGWMALRA